jgi:hypothetical protein
MPYVPRLRKLLAPLIEIQGDDDDCSTCRLFHWTVLDFLKKCRGDVFDERDCAISGDILARACLGYLRQERYIRLLVRKQVAPRQDTEPRSGQIQHEVWLDNNGSSIEDHHLLLYAAKYWYKHLDHLHDLLSLRETTLSFICSSNFHTLIQIQSLFMEHHFCVWPGSQTHKGLLRAFPSWFARSDPKEQKIWVEYRKFVHEWRHLLDAVCLDCELKQFERILKALNSLWVDSETNTSFPGLVHKILSEKAPLRQFAGALDRVWWNALGPDNFLSGTAFCGLYTTFSLHSEQKDGATRRWEGINYENRCVKLVKLR